MSAFPMKAITVALFISLILFTSTGWHIWKLYDAYRSGPQLEYRFQFLVSSINSAPELTNIARQSAQTGSLADMEMYKDHVREVDGAIKELLQIAPNQEIRDLMIRMDSANARLMRLESQAFDLVKSGRLEEARALLYSDQYSSDMHDFDSFNHILDVGLREAVEKKTASLRRRAFFSLGAIAGSIPGLLFVWLVALNMVRRHTLDRKHQERISDVLSHLEHSLGMVTIPREAALVILDAADQLFGWDACYLTLYSRNEDKFYSIVNMDTISGERKEVAAFEQNQKESGYLRSILNEGARLVLRNEKSPDIKEGPLFRFGDITRASCSLMFVPIRKGADNIGVLSIQSYVRALYTHKELDLLQVLADRCGGALERTFAEERLRQQEMLTRKLADLGKTIAAAVNPREAAVMILDTARQLFGWDAAFVNIYSMEKQELYDVVTFDTIEGSVRTVHPAYEGTKANALVKKALSGGPLLILRNPEDLVPSENLTPFGDIARPSMSLMFTPIRRGEKVVGVLSIQSYSAKKYSPRDLENLQILADHCSGALERILAETRLMESQERLRLLTSQISAILWSTDSDLCITQILGAGLQSLGLNPGHFVGKTLAEFFRNDDPGFLPIERHRCALAGESSSYETDLGGIYLRSFVEPLKDSGGAIIGCVCVSLDITDLRHAQESLIEAHHDLEKRVQDRTRELSQSNILLKREIVERKRAEDKLAESERIYRQAIENASGVPYRLNHRTESYEFVGEGVVSVLGITPEEMTRPRLLSMIREIAILDPDAPKDPRSYVDAFRRGEVGMYRADLRIETPSGEERWICDSSVPIREPGTNEIIWSVGILQDITRRKRMEEEALLQQERLVQTEKMVALGTLVSGVAHEINNPNHFILSNITLLLEVWQSAAPILEQYYRENGEFLLGGIDYSVARENIMRIITNIVQGSKRIKHIVQELRDFSRPSPPAVFEQVQVNQVIQSAVTLLHNIISKATLHFSMNLDQSLPAVTGHPQRLEQVVINLVQNACQALSNPEGTVSILTRPDPFHNMVCIEIRDEGVGILPEISRRICDPFFTTRRESGGTGLGLSISSRIVSEHGGTMSFDSMPGKGTTVTVALPVNSRMNTRENT